MVQPASCPPLPGTQERGTHGSGTGKENTKSRATRLKNSKSYSSEYGNKTYGEIKELAKQGDPKAKAMKKLIEQSARLMEKVGNK
jgi:hypothetical protein